MCTYRPDITETLLFVTVRRSLFAGYSSKFLKALQFRNRPLKINSKQAYSTLPKEVERERTELLTLEMINFNSVPERHDYVLTDKPRGFRETSVAINALPSAQRRMTIVQNLRELDLQESKGTTLLPFASQAEKDVFVPFLVSLISLP